MFKLFRIILNHVIAIKRFAQNYGLYNMCKVIYILLFYMYCYVMHASLFQNSN